MTKRKRSSTIHKLRIGLKLSLDEVEEAFSAATKEIMKAKRGKAEEVDLARIDIMKDETLVFFRGDRIVADSLKAILKNRLPKAKLKFTKTTAAALAEAP